MTKTTRFGLAVLWLASCLPRVLTHEQQPLSLFNPEDSPAVHLDGSHRRLQGRFLHITDIHHDSHYESNSNVGKRVCHHGSGRAGHYGTPGSDCDSPLALADETMEWIRENLRDKVDFVVWTGDNARHDNDEKLPRTEKDLVHSNELMIEKMVDVFSDDVVTASGDVEKHLRIPIVPNIGNNDIMPHNIFHAGPNRWTRIFDRIWKGLVPEEQRHTFLKGGWFSVEVIPNKLGVFSLNIMYFYKANSAVDGCAYKDEPGYEQMDWLRVQLQLLRERGMKAILIGHVPPARTSERRNWYDSCWQKYTLWLKQYRDVIVGSMYGHMNVDHFILQDFDDIKIGAKEISTYEGDEDEDSTIGTRSKMDYLDTLRDTWSRIPTPPPGYSPPTDEGEWSATGRRSKRRFLHEIGGPWSERYAVALVPPSVIPVYFPTLRVIEYNISGLDNAETWFEHALKEKNPEILVDELEADMDAEEDEFDDFDAFEDTTKKKKKKKKKRKKKKRPKHKKKFKVPKGPSPNDTPGPAYANQPFTFLGYTQYYANITRFNEEVEQAESRDRISNFWDYLARKESDTSLTDERSKPKFDYEIEYDTMNDPIYEMKDMTVNSYLDLARRMAKRSRKAGSNAKDAAQDPDGDIFIPDDEKSDEVHAQRQRVWKTFLKRAFVGFRDVD